MGELNAARLREAAAYADMWIAWQQQSRRVPGITVALRYRDELLLSRAYGFANLERQEPMRPDHIFRIASHSKTFTATAVMQLVERGALRLDDPVGAHLGWMTGEPAGVTLRQLLNHASGLIRDGEDADFWQLYFPFPDADALREIVASGGAVLPANESFKYSNVGYALLGAVIEAASGVPYNDYVGENIVRPLGLTSTGPEMDNAARARLVTGYTHPMLDLPALPVPDADTRAMSPATGFYATAEDLARYASAHFFGSDELLTDASKREMQAPTWAIPGSEERYGLGFAIEEIGSRTMVGHGGSFPGHATRTMFDPRDGLAVVVLTNETRSVAKSLASGIVRIINFALAQPDAVGESYDKYTGRFLDMWGGTDIVSFGNSLVMLSPADETPMGDVTELEVIDGDTLRIKKTGGYGSLGQPVRYSRADDGSVSKVSNAGVSMYPDAVFRDRVRETGSW